MMMNDGDDDNPTPTKGKTQPVPDPLSSQVENANLNLIQKLLANARKKEIDQSGNKRKNPQMLLIHTIKGTYMQKNMFRKYKIAKVASLNKIEEHNHAMKNISNIH